MEYQNPNKYITIGSGYQNRAKFDFEDAKKQNVHDFQQAHGRLDFTNC